MIAAVVLNLFKNACNQHVSKHVVSLNYDGNRVSVKNEMILFHYVKDLSYNYGAHSD